MAIHRNMVRVSVPLLLLGLFAGSAQAKSHNPKVMVLDLPPAQGISAPALKTLDEYLSGLVRDQGFDVVTPSQIGAVLGVEKQKELLGCSESNCLAELGGALGVDFIVMGTVALLQTDSVLTLTAVNQRGTAVGSQRKVVKDATVDALLPAMDELVPRLMKQARDSLAGPNLTQVQNPQVAPPPAGGLEAHPATSSGKATGAYVMLGTGAALIAASVVVGLLAKSSQSQAETDAAKPGAPNLSSDNSKTHTLALASTGLTVIGVGLAGGGAIWWATRGSSEDAAR